MTRASSTPLPRWQFHLVIIQCSWRWHSDDSTASNNMPPMVLATGARVSKLALILPSLSLKNLRQRHWCLSVAIYVSCLTHHHAALDCDNLANMTSGGRRGVAGHRNCKINLYFYDLPLLTWTQLDHMQKSLRTGLLFGFHPRRMVSKCLILGRDRLLWLKDSSEDLEAVRNGATQEKSFSQLVLFLQPECYWPFHFGGIMASSL